MRLILFEKNYVVGDRSEGNLWLWDVATYSVKKIYN